MPYLTHPDALGTLLPGEPAFRTRQLLRWLYRTPVLEPAGMTDLPPAVRAGLDPLWPFRLQETRSADGGRTVKWLLRTPDGAAVEAVLMAYRRRMTLCISSQAGCAMGCTFCATGQFGFERHLDAGEIVAQVAYAAAHLRHRPIPRSPDRITNVVFMGMGEPLANYEQVREAIRRMIELMGVSGRAITVSTVGVVPGIRRLAAERWPVTLAISLHAADDDLRARIVPVGRRYPIDDLVAAARDFRRRGRRVTVEWTLIAGVNDTPEQARGLAALAAEMNAHINVIPLNPTPLSSDRPPRAARVREFMDRVAATGATATLRDTRGRGIDAACGQLRSRAAQAAREESRRPAPPHRTDPAVTGLPAPTREERDAGGHR
jgi:23S rRNA (adenine2503-C2)-methyltransferase